MTSLWTWSQAAQFIWSIVYILPSPPLAAHYRSSTHMIRRNPTLIPLSDLEIQDVRDMYNEQKMEREKQEELLRKVKMISQNPELLKEDPQMLDNLTKGMAVTLKDKKQEDKAKRLGLDESKLNFPLREYDLKQLRFYEKQRLGSRLKQLSYV